MPELMLRLVRRLRRSSSGSALVGVLVFSVVMAISGVGYLSVATSAVSHEAAAVDNSAAILAGESGLHMGADWLHRSGAMPSTDVTPFGLSHANALQFAENNKTFFVDVIVKAASGNASEIWTEVYTSAGTHNATTFLKRLKMRAQADDFGRFGTYINKGPATPSSWNGLGGTKLFHGRFHWNDPTIRLRFNNGANTTVSTGDIRFFGDVTNANNSQSLSNLNTSNETGNNLTLTGNTGNIYNRGLAFLDNPINANYGDSIFRGRYTGGADVVASPAYISNFASGNFGGASNYPLPVDQRAQGSLSSDYRPLLQYNQDGTAVYKYYATSSATTQTTVNLTAADIGSKVLYSQTDISVKGKVSGNTTLATKSGESICVVGDLTYADFNAASADNGGVPVGSTNALGLVSGKNIVFNPQWVATRGGAATDITGSGVSGSRTKLYLNANMTMVNPSMAGSGGGYNGYEEWDTDNTGYKYVLHFAGSQSMNYWQPTTSGAGTGGESINYYYDERFASGTRPYGFQALTTSDGHLILSYGTWSESSVY